MHDLLAPDRRRCVATRMSTSRPSISMLIWPSCGRRRSTMFMPARILIRLTSAGPMDAGQVEHVVQRAVDAVADPDPVVLRLDVDVGGAVAQRLGDDHLHDLDDRRVVVGLRGLEPGRRRGAAPSRASNAWTWLSTPASAR